MRHGFEILARIGIHDFERAAPQRLAIAIEIDIDPSRLPGRDEHVIVGWKTLELDSFLRSVFGPTPAARSAAVELIWQRAVDYIPIRERLQPLLPGLFG